MTDAAQKVKKIYHGIVVSDKADKTISVRVDRMVEVSKYHRKARVSKKFAVHDPENTYKVGDTVSFVETRPLSKSKRWKVVKEVK
ncbi:MAG: 30S ribosomal protein S17 [Candidatus Kerfeldbacteria bacterium]|nr:30S ribosomal protein S17 [Candidatus Kerfeldbacteria bacterium]